MDESKNRLGDRLATIWNAPDFSTFFEKTATKPPHKMKKGTLIFNDGDPLGRIYFIKDGFVKLYRLTEEGRDGTSYLLGPGYLLGLRALLSEDESAKHNAEALTDVTIITLSRKNYLDAIEKEPALLVDLMHAYIDRLNYTEQKLVGFMFTDATARVAHFLADCAKRFCKEQKGAIVLPIPLTHQLIADLVGAFRETVTLSLKKLEKENVIAAQRGSIAIRNMQKLQEFASGSKQI